MKFMVEYSLHGTITIEAESEKEAKELTLDMPTDVINDNMEVFKIDNIEAIKSL